MWLLLFRYSWFADINEVSFKVVSGTVEWDSSRYEPGTLMKEF